LPKVKVTAVNLEFGTYPTTEIFWALRAENWLHHSSSSTESDADKIKAELLRAFYPSDEAWRGMVWQKGKAVVDDVLNCFEN